MHLEQAGLAVRVHPERLEQRQVARKPEPKLLPSESRAYREQGQISARMQEVLDIRQERASQVAKEQAQARTYWEGRKGDLGITGDQPMASEAPGDHHGPGTAPRPPASEDSDMREGPRSPLGHTHCLATGCPKSITRLGSKKYGDVTPKNQVRFWTERAAQKAGYRRAANDHDGPGTGVARTDRAATLAGEFQRLTRVMDPEDGRGHGDLNVRLHDEERARDRGMSW